MLSVFLIPTLVKHFIFKENVLNDIRDVLSVNLSSLHVSVVTILISTFWSLIVENIHLVSLKFLNISYSHRVPGRATWKY